MGLKELIRAQIRQGAEDVIGYRRHLHMNPETGFDTSETERFVSDFLERE